MSKTAQMKDDCKPRTKPPQHRAILAPAQTPARPDPTKRRPGSLSRAILGAALLLVLTWPAFATVTVTGLVSTVTSAALDTKFLFTPGEDVYLLNNGLSAGPAVITTSTNGTIYQPLEPGRYLVRLPLVPARKSFTIDVPHGTGFVNITNIIGRPWTYEQFAATVDGGGLTNNQVLPGIPTATNALFAGNFSGSLTGRVWVTGATVPWSIAAYDGGSEQWLAFLPSSNLVTGIFFKDNGNIELTGDIWTTGKFIGDGTAIGGTLTNNTTGTAGGLDATGLNLVDTRRKNSNESGTNNFAGNGGGVTNLQINNIAQRTWDDWTANATATPRLNYLKSRGESIRLLMFCDDAAIGTSADIHRIIQTNLMQTMTRGGSVTLSPNYCYLQGDGAGYTTHLGDGTQWFCQSGFIGLGSSTESFTNQTDLNEAIPTRFLTVNCAKINGGGTYTVSTQSLVNGVYGPKGTAFSFSADNGGAAAAYVTNFYLGGEFNVIASITSSGGTTNILQSLGQWTTNKNTFIYDMWDIANMSWLTAMTNALQSNFVAQVVSNYDAVIICDLGWPYLAAPYAASMWRDNFLKADLIYCYQPPGTNLTYLANVQAKTNYATISSFGFPLLDLGAAYLPSLYSAASNNVAVQPLYQSDGVHVTAEGGKINGQIIVDKLGLTPDRLKAFGYTQRAVAPESYSVTAHDGLLVSSGAIAASPLPTFLGPIYTTYGSRFIAGHLIPTSTRQVAVSIPSNKMVGKKTMAITQYFFTTNNQSVAASFKVYRIGCNPTTYAADSGSTDVTSLQTATSNVVFAISATNTFTYTGKPGEIYNALFGYGFSTSPTNGLWWLGADILMY